MTQKTKLKGHYDTREHRRFLRKMRDEIRAEIQNQFSRAIFLLAVSTFLLVVALSY